jgi:hypothetical protein
MDHWSWWRAIRLSWHGGELPHSVPFPVVERRNEKPFSTPLFLK